MRKSSAIFIAATLAAAAGSEVAYADETAVADDSLEEVIVTARKRAESLQRVPDSITAITAEQIEERRISTIAEALTFVPGVHIVKDQDAGMNIITVRGIGTNRNLAASVAFAVDGVLLPDSDAFNTDLADAERIEVLKGPQGALYGRNAIGGVINITTKRPTSTPEGEVRLGVARGDTVDGFAALSGPIASDKLVGRLTVKYRDSDGLIKNQFNGEPMDPDRVKKVGGRLLFQPYESLRMDFRASHFEQKTGASWYTTSDVLGTTGGKLTRSLTRLEPDMDQSPIYSKLKVNEVALTAELDTKWGTFSSITGYDDVDVVLVEDLDLTAAPVTKDVRQDRGTRGISQELRFTSPGENRLRFIGGAYVQNTKRDVATAGSVDFCFFVALPFCPTPVGVPSGILIQQNFNTTKGDFDQWAVFSQIGYDLTDTLEVTAALRYDQDDRSQLAPLINRRDKARFKDLQPKVSLAWKLSPDAMIYATYAEGYKSGTFNPPPAPGASFPLVVEQEGTDSYEIGAKTSWLERRVVANVSAYFTRYDDPQIFRFDVTTGGQVAINANKAKIKGGEFELTARVVHGFDLLLGYGYANAKFTDFDRTGLFDGNRLPNTPRYTLQVGGRFERPLNASMSLVTNVDYRKSGDIYFGEDNLIYQPSFQTVDARVGLQGDNWSVALWGRNIFDEPYAMSAFSRGIAPLIYGSLQVDPYTINPGRIYGIEGRWKF